MKKLIKSKTLSTKLKESIDRIYIEGAELLSTNFEIGSKYAYDIDFKTKKVVIRADKDDSTGRLVKMSKKVRKQSSEEDKIIPLMDIKHPDIKKVFEGITKCTVRVYEDKVIITPKKEDKANLSTVGALKTKVVNLFSRKTQNVSYMITKSQLDVVLKKASGCNVSADQLSFFDSGFTMSTDEGTTSNYSNICCDYDSVKELNTISTISKLLSDYKYFELFAGTGIGGMAFDELSCDNVGYSEIDNHASKNYDANFPNRVNFGDIAGINTSNLPDFDFLIGGSPCQDLSIMKRVWNENKQVQGLKGSESMLFFEYIRILNAKKPKWFVFENVQNLLKSNNGEDFKVATELFQQHYNIKWDVLNTADYGVPQTRRRLFIVGQLKELGDFEFKFPEKEKLKFFLPSILEKDVADKYFLSQKMCEYVMSEGTGNFKQKPEINLDIARPLTASMHKMHRAGTDNYVSVDNYVSSSGKTNIRRLTPREAARLQGLADSYKIVVSDTQAYRLMGNAMSLNVVKAIVKKLALYINRAFGIRAFA